MKINITSTWVVRATKHSSKQAFSLKNIPWVYFPNIGVYMDILPTKSIKPLPWMSWSSLIGGPSINYWPTGKLLSSFVSETMRISTFPIICWARQSNLFLRELVFSCPMIKLLIFPLRIAFSFLPLICLPLNVNLNPLVPIHLFSTPWKQKTLRFSVSGNRERVHWEQMG